MPAGTRSLLLRFPPAERNGEPVSFGVVLTPLNGSTLAAAHDGYVEALFWAETARVYATAGASFDVLYAGRVVGVGTVTDIFEGPAGQPEPGRRAT